MLYDWGGRRYVRDFRYNRPVQASGDLFQKDRFIKKENGAGNEPKKV